MEYFIERRVWLVGRTTDHDATSPGPGLLSFPSSSFFPLSILGDHIYLARILYSNVKIQENISLRPIE